MHNFVSIVSQAGADRFSVHARKAWLKGLSPKENRNIPPLRYPEIHRLKEDFPQLNIEINGGVKTHAQISEQLNHVDAVMIGRAAYDHPMLFAAADALYFNRKNLGYTRLEIFENMIPYIEKMMANGWKMMSITRHMLQLFAHRQGARLYKRLLGTASSQKVQDINQLKAILQEPILAPLP